MNDLLANRRVKGVLLGALLACILVVAIAVPLLADPGSVKYEYYDTNADTVGVFSGAAWGGQSFTPSVDHTITSVRLLIYRDGSPGDVTVSIRATDGSGHPTGNDLCVGTTDGDTLTTNDAGEWREITLGAGYDLSASVKYAIVLGVESLSDSVHWLEDETAGEYPGGCVQDSINSGVDWDFFTYPNCDYMFEEWGEPMPPTPTAETLSWLMPTAFILCGIVAAFILRNVIGIIILLITVFGATLTAALVGSIYP